MCRDVVDVIAPLQVLSSHALKLYVYIVYPHLSQATGGAFDSAAIPEIARLTNFVIVIMIMIMMMLRT